MSYGYEEPKSLTPMHTSLGSSPVGGLVGGPDMVRPRGEIEMEFKGLNIVTSELIDVINMLEQKLGPVLGPDMPMNSSDKEPGLATGVANEVRKNAGKVAMASMHVRRLIDRIQL